MREFTATDIMQRVGRMEQLASVRRLVSDDGKGRGMRVVEFNNGSGLNFTVLPDRGMDISSASYKGSPLAWLSCNADVSPFFFDPLGERWLRSWGGGLLTGCGLSNVGGPNEADGDTHGLHGRLSHIPAEELNTEAAWSRDGATFNLSASGRMRHTTVFNEKLLCTRRISTALGDNSITVCDTVENQGYASTPFMLLYHINLGWPLIDDGVTLEAADHKITPQTDEAARGLERWNKCSAPIPGCPAEVFYHELPADNAGFATMRVNNQKLGISLDITYRVAELPYLIQWKMMAQGEYVVGLEPANCFPEGQTSINKRGMLRLLEPGETTQSFVRLAITGM